MSSLYELSFKYQKLLTMMDSIEDVQLINDTLDSISDAIEDKAENIGKLIKSLDSEILGTDAEIKRLQTRKTSLKNKQDSLKKYLQENMELLGKDKIKTDLFSFGIQNNQAALNISDEKQLPSYFFEEKLVLDKAKLKDALKNGDEINGAELTQSRSLRIR